jgi:hypothetical protein
VVFKDGSIFQFHNPQQTTDWIHELTQPQNQFIIDKLEGGYGRECCDTNFHIVSHILNASPGHFSIFQSRARAEALGVLLAYKSMYMKAGQQHLYGYLSGSIKAFQLGNPTYCDVITLLIFPDNDRELRLELSGRKGKIRQPDIDFILTNFEIDR